MRRNELALRTLRVYVTDVTDVTDVTVENVRSPENHFIGVVFDGESHGDLHFGSFCRPDTVLALSSQSKGGSPVV